MKKFLVVLLVLFIGNFLFSRDLKVQIFGDQKNPAVIFLHGGPGYNSVSFERTTAKELAKNGIFVISYDRRGEGRNHSYKASYTFEEVFSDLLNIYKTYKIENAIIVGHSFGGIVGTLFTEKYPKKVRSLILVSTPISMQKTLKNIVEKSKEIYQKREDKINLSYIAMLEKMDTTTLSYASYCFMHAMANNFYATKTPNKKAKELYKRFKTDHLLKEYGSKTDFLAPQSFWKNEHYTTISLTENLKKILKQKGTILALYGKEDGLFSPKIVSDAREILGENNVIYLENCSHSIFIDQQEKFIKIIKKSKLLE